MSALIATLASSWLGEMQWYAALDGSDDPEAPPEEPLTWVNVGIAGLLLGINIFVSMWFGLGLSSSLIVAAARCVVQLTVLGMLLKQIFLTENPVYIFGMTMILGVLAAFEVTYWRSKRQYPWMYTGAFISITGSALLVALFGNAYALNMEPAYTAVKFIPTIGMLFGKCMIGVSIGVGSVMEALDSRRERVETMLCFGATRWEATKPLVVDALRNALLPTITNMGITGLISIPGMMTGWILGGADVLDAARYQQVVMFMISASTAASALASVLFTTFMLVDATPTLRLDRLTSSSSGGKISSGMLQRVASGLGYGGSKKDGGGELGNRSSSGRLLRIRSACRRPKSELRTLPSSRKASKQPSPEISGASTPISGSVKRRNIKAKHVVSEPPVDIEEAAYRCKQVCGDQPSTTPAAAAAADHHVCPMGEGSWQGNWCACCPLRAKLEQANGGVGNRGAALECYGFHEDPTDIVIPHPPQMDQLLLSVPTSSSSMSVSIDEGQRQRTNKSGRKIKKFTKDSNSGKANKKRRDKK